MTDDEAGAADLERGRKLFAGNCDFVKGVVDLDGLPAADRPEIAFAGRSNVGKSSLINALAGRRALARTSNTPGRTQEINFFHIGEALYLVDLPGYGFAKAPKPVVEAWVRLIKAYLQGRPNLRRVFLLIDSRHGTKTMDREIMTLLDTAAVPYQLVLTKADKLKPPARERIAAEVAGETKDFIARHPEILVTSAQKKWGLDEVRAEAAALAESGQ